MAVLPLASAITAPLRRGDSLRTLCGVLGYQNFLAIAPGQSWPRGDHSQTVSAVISRMVRVN